MTQIIKPVRTAGRFGAAGAVSLGITMGLFLIMQMLVGEQELELLPEVPPVKVDFWMEDKPMEVERDPRPTKPEVPPSPPMVITSVDPVGPQVGPTYNPPAIGPEVGPVTYSGNIDVGAYPKFRVPHAYPRRMLERGVEGWVIVGFSITKTGAVTDAQVIDSSHGGFERSALQAVNQYKYEPMIKNGEPRQISGQTIRLVWELTD